VLAHSYVCSLTVSVKRLVVAIEYPVNTKNIKIARAIKEAIREIVVAMERHKMIFFIADYQSASTALLCSSGALGTQLVCRRRSVADVSSLVTP
jgi:hypothetical protein